MPLLSTNIALICIITLSLHHALIPPFPSRAAPLEHRFPNPFSSYPAGTPLGDPIEVGAAWAVLGGKAGPQGRQRPLVLASDKSSVGHTEPAAGLSGVLHVVSPLPETGEL